jgi:hypothetical protein
MKENMLVNFHFNDFQTIEPFDLLNVLQQTSFNLSNVTPIKSA